MRIESTLIHVESVIYMHRSTVVADDNSSPDCNTPVIAMQETCSYGSIVLSRDNCNVDCCQCVL